MVNLDIRLRSRIRTEQIVNALLADVSQELTKNAERLKPVVDEAVNKSIEENMDEFVPTDEEAAELGVGVGGRIDISRTEHAWEALLVNSPQTVTSVTIEGVTGRRADNQFASIRVFIDEDVFYRRGLSNISIEASRDPSAPRLRRIPWMRWLINGAPVDNSSYGFSSSGPGASRTGGGVMVKGGVWSFSPARPNAFKKLFESIERNINTEITRATGGIIID